MPGFIILSNPSTAINVASPAVLSPLWGAVAEKVVPSSVHVHVNNCTPANKVVATGPAACDEEYMSTVQRGMTQDTSWYTIICLDIVIICLDIVIICLDNDGHVKHALMPIDMHHVTPCLSSHHRPHTAIVFATQEITGRRSLVHSSGHSSPATASTAALPQACASRGPSPVPLGCCC